MDFSPNKKPIEVIKEGAFGGTYFRDIYCGINGKWCKKSWKEFDQLKDIDQKFYCQIIMMSVSINMVLNAQHCYDFWKIRAGLRKYTLMDGFSGILGIG